jgi:hypothetical protein
MIAAAATQSGIWAQTTQSYNAFLLPTGSNIGTGTTSLFGGANNSINQPALAGGVWSIPVTAPNGLVYCFGASNSFKGLVAVCKPGTTSQKSKWFCVYDDYTTGTRPSLPNRLAGVNPQSGMVFNRKPILAPNGLMYLFPETNTPTSLVTFNPGSGTGLVTASAQGTISGDVLTITSMTSGTFGVGQTISYTDPITSATVTRTIVFYQLNYTALNTTGRGGTGTYKLDSAVLNNVVTPLTISGSEFPTCTWETETFANIASTKFSTTLNATQQANVTVSNLRGFVLAKDGYMYAIPNGPMLVRMAPKNTSINLTPQDRWEVHGFYNGTNTTTNAFRGTAVTRYFTPTDKFGNPVSKVAPYPTTNPSNWDGSTAFFRIGGLDSGTLHPNGKIYLTGTSKWIFILDPATWNNNSSDPNVIYTSDTLALRSNLVSPDIYVLREILLEKPLSTYIAKVVQNTASVGGATVIINVTDASYIYTGMIVTAHSGSGSFNGSVIVDSVDKINNTFVAKNTTGADVIQTNFIVNDTIQIAPTQEMIENVKMFVLPCVATVSNAPASPLRKIYTIDPANDTIYAIGIDIPLGAVGSNPRYSILPAIYPNGLMSKTTGPAGCFVNHIFTGSDYRITNVQSPPKMLQVDRQTPLTKANSIVPGYFGGVDSFASSGLSFPLSGGSTFSIGTSIGKVIYPSSGSDTAATGLITNAVGVSGEFISLKGYSAFTKYFNYAPSDRNVYEPPADLYNNLATSLYNSYVNKLH